MKLAKETALYNEGAVEAVNDKAELAGANALEALQIAGNTDQYFWHTETGTDTGAHITEIPQADFIANPENGGGNLLARSNGIAVRDGLTELALFSASGVRIGLETAYHTEVENDGFSIVSGNHTIFSAGQTILFSPNLQGGELKVSHDDSTADFAMNVALSDMSRQSSDTRTASATKGSVAVGGEYWYIDFDSGNIVYVRTEASGEHSLAIGKGAVASGDESSAHGIGVVAGQTAQFVVGKYNDNKTGTLFEIGNGAGAGLRSNAMEVDTDGNVTVSGSLVPSTNYNQSFSETISSIAGGSDAWFKKPIGSSVTDLKKPIFNGYDITGASASVSRIHTYASFISNESGNWYANIKMRNDNSSALTNVTVTAYITWI